MIPNKVARFFMAHGVYSNLLFRNIFVQYLLGYRYKHSNCVMLVSPMTTFFKNLPHC